MKICVNTIPAAFRLLYAGYSGRGITMKIRFYFFAVFLLLVCLPAVQGADAEYGKIRALQQRAAHIIRQKNDFISRVLTSYSIPYKCNADGVVVSISNDGR